MDSRVVWRVFWGDGDSRGIFPRQFVAFVPFAKAVDQEVPVIEQRLSALLLLLMSLRTVTELT